MSKAERERFEELVQKWRDHALTLLVPPGPRSEPSRFQEGKAYSLYDCADKLEALLEESKDAGTDGAGGSRHEFGTAHGEE